MSLDRYLAFVATAAALMLIPGPNVALIVATSVARGARCGLVTVAGTSTAMALQLLLVVAGMTTFLAVFAQWFAWLRWAGVCYLIWLGWRSWRASPVGLEAQPSAPMPGRRLYWRGVLVSLTNPKTLFFYGAFLPQFISRNAQASGRLMILGVTFVAVAVVFDSCWALLAGRARRLIAMHGRLRQRLTGGLLIGAGVGLALARKG